MKHSFIRKLSLTTLALLVSFAITARANGPGDLLSISARGYGYGGVLLQTNQAPPGSLWYNGDFNGVNGLANEQNTLVTDARTYDDFNVTDSGGWDVTALFSDNLADTGITGANWEIRTGVSVGNGGTLLFSGTTTTPIVTATGRSGFGFTEFQVEVDGLSIHLDPGTYWLNVTPIGDFNGRSFVSTTSGADAVGTPPGNNQNAFFDSTFFGFNFASTGDPALGQPYDFSMGVIGTVTTGGGGLSLVSAQSVVGKFAIDLPLVGTPGVECRSAANRQYKVVFTFNNLLTSVDSVATSCGSTFSNAIVGSDAHKFIVNLTNDAGCNTHDIAVSLTGVHDDQGNTLASASATMGLLIGDVSGDGVVDQHDVHLTNNDLNKKATNANFREDVNVSGHITASDVFLVQTKVGTSLP